MLQKWCIPLCVAIATIGLVTAAGQINAISGINAVTACFQSTCNNTDPMTYGQNGTACAYLGARTDETYFSPTNIVEVHLRWSSGCDTHWARTYNRGSQAYYIKALLKDNGSRTAYKGAGDMVYSNQQYNAPPITGWSWNACGGWNTTSTVNVFYCTHRIEISKVKRKIGG